MVTKNRLFVVVLLVAAAALFWHFSHYFQPKQNSAKPVVVCSNLAIYDAAKHIGASSIEPALLMPFGTDIHSYEPTPQDIIKINNSALFVYSGAVLEPWAKNLIGEANSLELAPVVKLIKHGNHTDPHYWLDVENMILIANTVEAKLSSMFPQNKELYAKNSKAYVDMLNEIDAKYRTKLSSCKLDTIVVNHNAFSYMAQKYGFKIEAVSGLSPEAEASAKQIAHLSDLVKLTGIKTIFYENFASDKVIKSLASDAGLGVMTLSPLENLTKDEMDQQLCYEDILKQNLEKISKALECR